MRWLLVLLLAILAGCASGPTGTGTGSAPHPSAQLLTWSNEEVPFEAEFEVPPGTTTVVAWTDVSAPGQRGSDVARGTTLVRAATDPPEEASVVVFLENSGTGRRRCQPEWLRDWRTPPTGGTSCAALTHVDELPATWRVRVVSATGAPVSALVEIRIELRTDAPQGLAAKLDLDGISQRSHATRTFRDRFTASDGADISMEITMPAGEGRYPAIFLSSPYNDAFWRAAGLVAEQDVVLDWAPRGYAIVVADVRGTAGSGGCLDLWGAREQLDQAELVEWIAGQGWSDGNVGGFGQSYVATTALAAAAQRPAALKAVVAIAPMVSPYLDWNFGGVPNGEGPRTAADFHRDSTKDRLARPGTATPDRLACATLADRADLFDGRGLYSASYGERDLARRAENVEAAVLYTQGFLDDNVKPAMLGEWMDELRGPRLALVGPWDHQHPRREDTEVLILAWFDHHLKGVRNGVDALEGLILREPDGSDATFASWAALHASPHALGLDLEGGVLGQGAGTARLDPQGSVVVALDVTDEVEWAGAPELRLRARLPAGGNAHLKATLTIDGQPVTFGMINLAHDATHTRYTPYIPGEARTLLLRMLPFFADADAGSRVELEIRFARVDDWEFLLPGPSVVEIDGSASWLTLFEQRAARGSDEA